MQTDPRLKKFCLFGLRLYVPVNNFSVMSGRFPGLKQYNYIKQ